MEKSQKRPEAMEKMAENQATAKKELSKSPLVRKFALAILRKPTDPPARRVAKAATQIVMAVLTRLARNAQQLPKREQRAEMPTISSRTEAMTAIMNVIWIQRTKVAKAFVEVTRKLGMLTGLPFFLARFWS